MESSVFSSVGRLVQYRVPVDAKDVLLFGAGALSRSGPSGGGEELGLSRGVYPPFLYVLILEAEMQVLEGIWSRFLWVVWGLQSGVV